MSSVVVMHDEVKTCRQFISSVGIVECDYTFEVAIDTDQSVATIKI